MRATVFSEPNKRETVRRRPDGFLNVIAEKSEDERMPVMPSAELRARIALDRAGFTNSHSLGQNFIMDEQLLSRLLAEAGVDGEACALEIGPGCGLMTALLAQRCGQVLAVELDERLRPVLEEVLHGCDNVAVRFGDFLKLSVEQAAPEGFDLDDYIVMANLPYYITSDILTRLIESAHPPKRIVIMVQQEAAQRITSQPGGKQWCALAALTAWYGDAQVIADVPRTAFQPQPHVDSALLAITRREDHAVPVRDTALLFATIRAAFAMRRKKLTNNLKASFGLDQGAAVAVLERAGLDANVRGEALQVDQLCAVANEIHALRRAGSGR